MIGSSDSLSTPHEYDLGTRVTPGTHVLTIRVDNSLVVDIGVNSHSISDHTQGNWNGIVGRMTLEATAPVWVDDLQVFPDVAARVVRVSSGASATPPGRRGQRSLRWRLDAWSAPTRRRPRQPRPVTVPSDVGCGRAARSRLGYALGPDAVLWDEFTPRCIG